MSWKFWVAAYVLGATATMFAQLRWWPETADGDGPIPPAPLMGAAWPLVPVVFAFVGWWKCVKWLAKVTRRSSPEVRRTDAAIRKFERDA